MADLSQGAAAVPAAVPVAVDNNLAEVDCAVGSHSHTQQGLVVPNRVEEDILAIYQASRPLGWAPHWAGRNVLAHSPSAQDIAEARAYSPNPAIQE